MSVVRDHRRSTPGPAYFPPEKATARIKPRSVRCPVCKVGVDEFCITVGNTGWSHNPAIGIEVGRPMKGTHEQRRRMAVRKMNEERES